MQKQKQAPCREPYVGLDPGILGSRPELKADAQLLSHPGVPNLFCFAFFFCNSDWILLAYKKSTDSFNYIYFTFVILCILITTIAINSNHIHTVPTSRVVRYLTLLK